MCEFKLEDVLGIQVSQTPPIYNDNACELNLHLYLVVNPWTPSHLRALCSALIVFDSAEDFKSNLSSAKEWKTKVLMQTQKAVKATFVDAAESEGDGQRCDSRTSECELTLYCTLMHLETSHLMALTHVSWLIN